MARTNGYSWSPASGGGAQSGGAAQDDNLLPLCDAQLGIWFAQTIEPSSPAFNLAEYLEIAGSIDASLFERALRHVVRETEALCVRFVNTRDGPRQIIGLAPEFSLSFVDVSAEIAPREAAEQLRLLEQTKELLRQLSDLSQEADAKPSDSQIRRSLAEVCTKLGKPDLAQMWQRAASFCPPDPALSPEGAW